MSSPPGRAGPGPPQGWDFSDPPNTAALTLRRIVEGGRPVLLVARDDDDGMFQFLDGGDVSEKDAMIVSLARMIQLDPSLTTLAALERGWTAHRVNVLDPWVFSPASE